MTYPTHALSRWCELLTKSKIDNWWIAEVNLLLSELSDDEIFTLNALILDHKKHYWLSRSRLVAILREDFPYADERYDACLTYTKNSIEVLAYSIPEEDDARKATISDLIHLSRPSKAELENEVRRVWRWYDHHSRYWLARIITGGLRSYGFREAWWKALAEHHGVDMRTMSYCSTAVIAEPQTLERVDEFAKTFRSSTYDIIPPHILAPAYAMDLEEAAYQIRDLWSDFTFHITTTALGVEVWTMDGCRLTPQFPDIRDALTNTPTGSSFVVQVYRIDPDAGPTGDGMSKRMLAPPVNKSIPEKSSVFLSVLDIFHWKGEDLTARSWKQRQVLLREIHPQYFIHPSILHSDVGEGDFSEVTSNKKRAYVLNDICTYRELLPERHELVGMLRYVRLPGQGTVGGHIQYTVAIQDEDAWIPIFTDVWDLEEEDGQKLWAYIRPNTEERFGPVRMIAPGLRIVVEYHGARPAPRSKAGIQLLNARFHKIEEDEVDVTQLVEIRGG